jgi:hypothetical protein
VDFYQNGLIFWNTHQQHINCRDPVHKLIVHPTTGAH